MNEIDINDLHRISNPNLIDVREIDEFADFAIANSNNIPLADLMVNHQLYLNKDETYYLICRVGARSGQATYHLSELGYNVINCRGGVLSYIPV